MERMLVEPLCVCIECTRVCVCARVVACVCMMDMHTPRYARECANVGTLMRCRAPWTAGGRSRVSAHVPVACCTVCATRRDRRARVRAARAGDADERVAGARARGVSMRKVLAHTHVHVTRVTVRGVRACGQRVSVCACVRARQCA